MFMRSEEPDHRRQFRDSVAGFAADNAATQSLRQERATAVNYSPARYRDLAELGCTSVILPEAFDGLEMEHGDLVAMHQEIGRAALTEPLGEVPLLVAQTLALGGNTSLAQAQVPALVGGELIATLAWQAGLGAIGATEVGPVATKDGDGWCLSGEARLVPLSSSATASIVAARCGGGVALFWLSDMPEPFDPVTHADGSQQGTLRFDDLHIGADMLIAGPETGGAILEEVLDLARLAISAQLLGLMERALEMTLEHLRQREQFGKPIGSFQALQHRAVNLYIQLELSRSAIDRAARAMDTGADVAKRAAQVSAAKSRAGDAAQLIVRECIQMHGAIGYTTEYDLSLYANRMLFLSGCLGNARTHRKRWAALENTAELGANV